MASASTRSSSRTIVDRVFRNPDTGELVLWQTPNPPLIVFLVATAVRLLLHPHGNAGTATSVVSGIALAWWAVDEVARGDSLFRRILGAVVLVGMVVMRLL
jgi:hypothetical protein